MGQGSGCCSSAGQPAVSTGPAWAGWPISTAPGSPSAAAKSSASWPGNGSALCRISVALRIAILPWPVAAVATGRRMVPPTTASCRRVPGRCPTQRERLSPRRRALAPDASRTLDPYGTLCGLRRARPVDRLTPRPSFSTPAPHVSLRTAARRWCPKSAWPPVLQPPPAAPRQAGGQTSHSLRCQILVGPPRHPRRVRQPTTCQASNRRAMRRSVPEHPKAALRPGVRGQASGVRLTPDPWSLTPVS